VLGWVRVLAVDLLREDLKIWGMWKLVCAGAGISKSGVGIISKLGRRSFLETG